MVAEVSRATKPVVQLPNKAEGKIEWNSDETKELREKIFNWWNKNKKVLELTAAGEESNWGTDNVMSQLEGIDEFLVRVVLPNMEIDNENEVSSLLDLLWGTREHGVFFTTALPYLLLHPLDKREKVTQTIFDDLSFGSNEAVKKSAQAVRHWIHLADAGLVEQPPDTVLDRLIERVIFRQREGIDACLTNLTFLLSENPRSFSLEQANRIVSCLIPWHDATCLPVSEQNGDFPEEERPDLRVLLGRLTSALSDWFENKPQREPSESSLMRERYRSDPLPEVRRSLVSS